MQDFSLVISTYDRPRDLARLLAFLDRRQVPWRVDRRDVIARYAARHQNIRVLQNETNRGLLFSIARAMEAATMNFIVWAAADDKLLPEFLARNMALLERHPEAVMSFSIIARHPTILSPFGTDILFAALRNPLAWPIAIPFGMWYALHWLNQRPLYLALRRRLGWS